MTLKLNYEHCMKCNNNENCMYCLGTGVICNLMDENVEIVLEKKEVKDRNDEASWDGVF